MPHTTRSLISLSATLGALLVLLTWATPLGAQDAKPVVVSPKTASPFTFQPPSLERSDDALKKEIERRRATKGTDDLNPRPLGKSPAEKANEANKGADAARK